MGERIHSGRVRNEGKTEMVGKPIAPHGAKFNVKSEIYVPTAPAFSFFLFVWMTFI